MRYAPEQKQATRERVLGEAAKQIRVHGPSGVGVAEIMKRAGLTHGGFYAHFPSKDALIAAAIDTMFEAGRARFAEHALGRPPREALTAYIDWYLSAKHRDDRATACPIAGLSSDVPRLSKAARDAYANGVTRVTKAIASLVRELGHRDAEAQGRSVVAELAGALALSRVEPDAARSTEILAASRRALRARLGLGARS
jgi:TetR/AcrR family transcriptional repressor of nem operon